MSSSGRLSPGVSLAALHDFMSSSSLSSSSSFSSSSSTLSCSIDESYKYIFLPICYSFTFLFSLSLNSVVLYRSFRRTRRWNASLIYMVNLASTDLMYGLSLPFLVASYVMHDRWVFGDFMCRLVRFLFYFNLYGSIFFLTCISVHRYLGICHPMKVITLETKKAVKSTCVLVWIVVFALTCPIFRFAQTSYLTRWSEYGGLGSNGSVENRSSHMSSAGGNSSRGKMGVVFEGYQNCWDDAIDKEFTDYVPYGITLHLLGFFIPFSIIAWCYSHVVLTIFRTLHSQPSSYLHSTNRRRAPDRPDSNGSIAGRRGSNGLVGAAGGDEGISIIVGARSPYASRRRKSIRTIVTITLLFALCFFPFHVTRTIFLILKVTKSVPCHTMTAVSMCYKITRPLASFNAWLNALLYFLTKDKGGAPCCPRAKASAKPPHALLLPLRTMGREAAGDAGAEENVEEDNKTFHNLSGMNRSEVKYEEE